MCSLSTCKLTCSIDMSFWYSRARSFLPEWQLLAFHCEKLYTHIDKKVHAPRSVLWINWRLIHWSNFPRVHLGQSLLKFTYTPNNIKHLGMCLRTTLLLPWYDQHLIPKAWSPQDWQRSCPSLPARRSAASSARSTGFYRYFIMHHHHHHNHDNHSYSKTTISLSPP